MDTDWITTLQALPWETAGQIMLAGLLGGMIGFERAWHGHPAGLRTTSLVAVGSCLFTILSITAFPVHGSTQDTARIAAQIVSGIGFIGAGVLIQSKNRVRGITTPPRSGLSPRSAWLWVQACIFWRFLPRSSARRS